MDVLNGAGLGVGSLILLLDGVELMSRYFTAKSLVNFIRRFRL